MKPVQLEEALEIFQNAVKLIKVSLEAVEPKADLTKYFILAVVKNIQDLKISEIEENLSFLCDK